MGNRLVAGRSIAWTDVHARRSVVVISESLAREYWQEPARAIGKRVRYGNELPWREIVGVVGHEHDDGLTQPPTKMVYWPLLNDSYQQRDLSYVVRSSRVGTPGFMREVQQAVWSVQRNPLAAVQTLEDIQATSMARTSFIMILLTIAAGVALVLSVVGIYGVVAYVARQRTREIGVRIALGARRRDVHFIFLRHGVQLTAVGVVLGLGLALVATRVVSALLFGVSPMDPITFMVVSCMLGGVAILAAYLPARRASRVDPIVALRGEL